MSNLVGKYVALSELLAHQRKMKPFNVTLHSDSEWYFAVMVEEIKNRSTNEMLPNTQYVEVEELLKHQRKMRGYDVFVEGEFWDFAVLIKDIWSIPTVSANKNTETPQQKCVKTLHGSSFHLKCTCGAEINGDAYYYNQYQFCPKCSTPTTQS